MRWIIISLAITFVYTTEMAITKEKIEYLKKTVNWEVTEYEDNIFKEWTEEEIQSLMITNIPYDDDSIPSIIAQQNLPTTINWVGSKCDHKVINQGQCSGAHSVAVAGMLSDRCCLQGNDHGWLSIQELISCDVQSKGCLGGWPTWNLDYVVKSNGWQNSSHLSFHILKGQFILTNGVILSTAIW